MQNWQNTRSWLMGGALLSLGCTTGAGPAITYDGDTLWQSFPQDGDVRIATFISEGSGLPHQAVGTVQPDPEQENDGRTFVYTTVFQKLCLADDPKCKTGEELHRWKLSADSTFGVQMWQVNVGGTRLLTEPLRLADAEMFVDDVIENTVDGNVVTSTYMGEEVCPAPYWRDPDTRPMCNRIDLDDGGAGTGFTGSIWATVQFGITAFDLEAFGTSWNLKDYEYDD